MKIAIVSPVHIQPSEKWVAALKKESEASGASVIIIDDSDGAVSLPFECYDYDRQREELGDDLYAQFRQFHHSAACKQFGLWLAYRDKYDVVIVLDSDCIVSPGFVESHTTALQNKDDAWVNPLDGSGLYSRGLPYSKRNVDIWAHMGLWTNELDLYGKDRIGAKNLPKEPPHNGVFSTSGAHFPQSGMNISFVREAIPFMLFLPNFKYGKNTFTRHDDIWGGYVFQKIAFARNKSISLGQPWVYHDTVVVPEDDAKAEGPMMKYEDEFIDSVNESIVIVGAAKVVNPVQVFSDLGFCFGETPVFRGLEDACVFWGNALNAIV